MIIVKIGDNMKNPYSLQFGKEPEEYKDIVRKGRDKQAGKELVCLYRRLHYYRKCRKLYHYYCSQGKEIRVWHNGT